MLMPQVTAEHRATRPTGKDSVNNYYWACAKLSVQVFIRLCSFGSLVL